MRLQAEIIGRLADVPAADWDALDPTGNPFLRRVPEALKALVASGATRVGTAHCCCATARPPPRRGTAIPQGHSWGEFIFDWSWAQSYARSGLDYPKQLSAIPYTR
jgi:predicted N-acyltransferase